MIPEDAQTPIVESIYNRAQKLDFTGAQNIIRAAQENADVMPRDKRQFTLGLLFQAAVVHDPDTAGHVARVSIIAGTLAQLAGKTSCFQEELAYSSPPHDIGKMATPDHILHKKGSFDRDEWVIMRKHVGHGYRLLNGIEGLDVAAQIALHHHHKFNGCKSGYPGRVSADQIPEAAQFFPLADIYDALRSERPYKKGMSHEQAMHVILNGDGRTKPTHFNPDILDVMRGNSNKIKDLYTQLQAGEVTMALNPDGILVIQDQRVQQFAWVNNGNMVPEPVVQAVEDPFLKMLREHGASSGQRKPPVPGEDQTSQDWPHFDIKRMRYNLERYRQKVNTKKRCHHKKDI